MTIPFNYKENYSKLKLINISLVVPRFFCNLFYTDTVCLFKSLEFLNVKILKRKNYLNFKLGKEKENNSLLVIQKALELQL